jgi:subtilisin
MPEPLSAVLTRDRTWKTCLLVAAMLLIGWLHGAPALARQALGPVRPPRATGASPMAGRTRPASGAIAGRYIVVLKASAPDPGTVAARHAKAYGARVTHVYRSALKGYSATIPAEHLAALRASRAVKLVAPDVRMSAAGQVAGSGVERIKAMGKANQGAGVNVAVIDTGIDLTHPDLAANIAGGTNCSKGGRSNYADGNGHGTHVAGIIAALDNGIGVVGVAPQAKLWAVRVLDDKGSGSTSDVVCGIDFVDAHSPAKGGPITVANMSLGGWGSDDGNCGNTNADAMHLAICRAVGDGVTFAVAAGNSGMDVRQFTPAAYDEVITVSALGDSDGHPCDLGAATTWAPDDTFASFSNYATSSSDLGHLMAAPGVSIYSTYKGGTYATLSGTSMASPHVAGAAALYIASHPGASPASVRDALMSLGEPENVNFGSECAASSSPGKHGGATQAGFSHTDPSVRHPEVELRADSL